MIRPDSEKGCTIGYLDCKPQQNLVGGGHIANNFLYLSVENWQNLPP